MALTGENLVDEVQVACGRTGDTVLITDARITRWLNEGQRVIAEKVPGLHELTFKNTTSLDTTVQLSWPLSDVTSGLLDDTASNHVAHTFKVTYLDGNETRSLTYQPVDEFDCAYPDPTHTDIPHTQPVIWTRRGNSLEIMPLCLTEYCDKDWRFDFGFYPVDFTTNDSDTSDLNDADEGLIAYAVWKAFVALGAERATDAAVWRTEFYGWLEEYKDQNDTMPEWSGNWYE